MASDAGGEDSTIILPIEAEALAEGLKLFAIKEVGCARWQKQHQYLEKLNMQALLNATEEKHDYIQEALINTSKVSLLVQDLITTEVWKSQIFDVIAKTDFSPSTTIPLYLVVYHEATICTLLETILFHRESMEAAEDTVLDLLDYCYRKLTRAISDKKERGNEIVEPEKEKGDTMQEMKAQCEKMEFELAVKCLSILRYISDYLDSVPLSTPGRMLNTLNIPCLLVQLVQDPPWTRHGENGIMKFIDTKWVNVSGADTMQLTKVEGQVWLTAYNLLMHPQCAMKYEFNTYNKTQVLKLRGFMNDVLLDQLPILAHMRQFLEQLSLTEPPPPKSELVLEQLPEIMDSISNENRGKWKAIAKFQMKNYFNPSQDEIREQAKALAETYNIEAMNALLPDVPKCSNCGAEATKRCARCRTEWYCKRECQVIHWKKHKTYCVPVQQEVK